MIAFEINLNDKQICIAGAEDLTTLFASVHANGKLGATSVGLKHVQGLKIYLNVRGFSESSDSNWANETPLQIGDVVQLRVLDTANAHPPVSRDLRSK